MMMAALKSLWTKCRKPCHRSRTHLTSHWNPRDSLVIACGRKALLSLWPRHTTRARASRLTVVTYKSMRIHKTRQTQCSLSQMMTPTTLGTSPSIMIIQSRSKDQGSFRRCHPRAPPRRWTCTKRPLKKCGACSSSQWAPTPSLKAARREAAATATEPSRAHPQPLCPLPRWEAKSLPKCYWTSFWMESKWR